jgi:amidase
MKCLVAKQSSLDDYALFDLPWRVGGPLDFRLMSSNRPTFAVLRNDGTVLPHPPVQRALDMAVRALQIQGYQVIDWIPPSHASAVRTLFEILGADGAQGIRAAMQLSGEPPVAELSSWYFGSQDVRGLPTSDFWELCERRSKYQREYQEYWNSTKALTSSQCPVDGVIMPVAPTAAVQEGNHSYFGMNHPTIFWRCD